MTDAFLTAAALAAVADGTTRITNIANQRVKECNRILAMVTELGKCGVQTKELPDGIEVTGSPPAKLHGASIHCYNDHRVAMAFAVLGCKVRNVVMQDKHCVRFVSDFYDHLFRQRASR